ncbi:MAG: hypothetical protein N2053_11420 [Chitinispirillaceae bacterium]|nr:hypothetical protein [Chitinispirillaceae bacterium]
MLNSANFNNNSLFQIALPILQPLRLWNSSPRKESIESSSKKTNEKKNKRYEEAFSLKVGFIEKSNGEKQMLVAGRIFKIHKD